MVLIGEFSIENDCGCINVHYRRRAKRRHTNPQKSKNWIIKRYWHKEGTRNHVFAEDEEKLKLFADTKIVRHPGLKLERNPYLDKEYFEIRKERLRTQKKIRNSINI